jgi:hypothetical protein
MFLSAAYDTWHLALSNGSSWVGTLLCTSEDGNLSSLWNVVIEKLKTMESDQNTSNRAFIVTCHYQKHLALTVLLCCLNVSNCLSLLQNHATQFAELIHTDLRTVWQNKFTGKKCSYLRAYMIKVLVMESSEFCVIGSEWRSVRSLLLVRLTINLYILQLSVIHAHGLWCKRGISPTPCAFLEKLRIRRNSTKY